MLPHFCIHGSSTVAPTARLCLKLMPSSETSRSIERMLIMYSPPGRFLLQIYARNYFVAETDSALMPYTQIPHKFPSKYAEMALPRLLTCRKVTIRVCSEISLPKISTSWSIIESDRAAIRIQRQPRAIWPVSRRCLVRSRRGRTLIQRKDLMIVRP